MKVDIGQIRNILDQHKEFLANTYHVKNMGVFGSVARGEASEASDIDMLVEFSKPISFFRFIELEEFLSKIVGKKVDLVTEKALKPAIKEEVLQQLIYV